MSQHTDNSLDQPGRRAFVKQVVAGGAIAVPVIATFSLASVLSDAQTVTSSATLSSSSRMVCLPDPGYDGPGRFAAHLVYAGDPGNIASRINGEIVFLLGDGDDNDRKHDQTQDHGHGHDQRGAQDRRVRTELRITGENNGGLTVDSAALLINSGYACALQSGRGTITAVDVAPSFCDLDFVLNAMAAGQASVLVLAHYLGQPINLAGPVAAAGPDFNFVSLRG